MLPMLLCSNKHRVQVHTTQGVFVFDFATEGLGDWKQLRCTEREFKAQQSFSAGQGTPWGLGKAGGQNPVRTQQRSNQLTSICRVQSLLGLLRENRSWEGKKAAPKGIEQTWTLTNDRVRGAGCSASLQRAA